MTLKLGIVMDPIESINFKKDTTLGMLWAAQDKDWQLFYIQQHNLYLRDGEVFALVQPVTVNKDPANFYQLQPQQAIKLTDLDIVMMRKDPPFDNEYLYSTYLLELAENKGLFVVNKPQSLRDCNEKIFATWFPQCCPTTLVSRDGNTLKAFLAEHKDVIYKPLDGMGGTAIFRVKLGDPNLNVILETITEYGQRTIMAQQFIPAITQGDKRILLIDGQPIPYCLARIPAEGENRGNLAAGGTGVAQELTERDYWICEQVAPTLKEKGLIWVGLDVIGDHLTEINVTSPTCAREISEAYNIDILGQLMDCIEQKFKQR